MTQPQPEAFVHTSDGLFDATGQLAGDSRKFLQGWMDRYVNWVKKHTG